MLKNFVLSIVVMGAAAAAWAELASTLGGCGLPAQEPPPDEGFAVGGVDISAGAVEGDHSVGVTSCPQELGTVTFDNGTDANRRLVFGTVPFYLVVFPPSAVIEPGTTQDVLFSFDCGTTTSFTGDVPFEVQDEGDAPLGDGVIEVAVNISGG